MPLPSILTYAYVDPAVTAMMTQIVAGVVISLGVAFGVFRRKVFMFFKNISVKHTQRKIERQAKKDKAS
jgi:O-antigen/teichoic acid export membrane protein